MSPKPMSKFGLALVHGGANWCNASAWLRAQDGENADVSLAARVDALLLELGTLLWFEQVLRWNPGPQSASEQKAWTEQDKITEMIRWYLLGQSVGKNRCLTACVHTVARFCTGT